MHQAPLKSGAWLGLSAVSEGPFIACSSVYFGAGVSTLLCSHPLILRDSLFLDSEQLIEICLRGSVVGLVVFHGVRRSSVLQCRTVDYDRWEHTQTTAPFLFLEFQSQCPTIKRTQRSPLSIAESVEFVAESLHFTAPIVCVNRVSHLSRT